MIKRFWRRFLFGIKLKLINKFFLVPLAKEFSNEDAFKAGRELAKIAAKWAKKMGKVVRNFLIIVAERLEHFAKGFGSAIRPEGASSKED